LQQHLNIPQICHSQNQREAHNRDKKKARKKIRTRKAFNEKIKIKSEKKLEPKNRSF